MYDDHLVGQSGYWPDSGGSNQTGALAVDACMHTDEGGAIASFIRQRGDEPNLLAFTHRQFSADRSHHQVHGMIRRDKAAVLTIAPELRKTPKPDQLFDLTHSAT